MKSRNLFPEPYRSESNMLKSLMNGDIEPDAKQTFQQNLKHLGMNSIFSSTAVLRSAQENKPPEMVYK